MRTSDALPIEMATGTLIKRRMTKMIKKIATIFFTASEKLLEFSNTLYYQLNKVKKSGQSDDGISDPHANAKQACNLPTLEDCKYNTLNGE